MTRAPHRIALLLVCVLPLAFAPIPSLAKEKLDPDVARLDSYEAAAQAMNDLARRRLQNIQTVLLPKLGERITSEIVGKSYVPDDDKENLGGCWQEVCSVTSSRELECKRGRELVTYSKSELTDALFFPQTFLSLAAKKLTAALGDYLEKNKKTRRLLTWTAASAETPQSEVIKEGQKRQHSETVQAMDWDYARFCRFQYQMVLSGHVEEILLRLEEMADRTGKKGQNFRLPSPLGIACQMQSELQNAERKDEEEIARIESAVSKDSLQASSAAHSGDDGAAETARVDQDRLSKKADELTQRCDEREEKDLAAMAAKLREISARFFSERAGIREEMIRWRADCIKQHFYPGEGEAAISSVYGSQADLSTENFENLKFPFDEVTKFLRESTFSPGSSNLYLNNEFSLPSMTPHSACAGRLKDKNPNSAVPGMWTTDVKSVYPDLCGDRLDCLHVSESAPLIQEGTASGAALFERP